MREKYSHHENLNDVVQCCPVATRLMVGDGIIISEILNIFDNFDQKRRPYPPFKPISLRLHKMKAKKPTMFE